MKLHLAFYGQIQKCTFFCPQCSVSVSDQGYPEVNIDEAGVRITVQRDIALPKFDQTSYRRDVSESAAVNTSVAQVNARMEGINVSIHRARIYCLAAFPRKVEIVTERQKLEGSFPLEWHLFFSLY